MPGLFALLLAALSPEETEGYEQKLLDWGLQQQHRELERNPEGKSIEELLVSGEEVFAPTDPWPYFLNVVHVRTRKEVVLREVLLNEGEPWNQTRVEESERNLRRLGYLAVARIVAVKGKAGGVGLLVVVKDRLSLRFNSFFNLVGDLLQLLLLRPTEVNFLGRGQEVILEFLLKLDTLQISETFRERRLFGTTLALSESVGVVLNRNTGSPEGTVGTISIGRPLVSLDQHWAFNVEGGWRIKTLRTFCGAVVCNQAATNGSSTAVPRAYRIEQGRVEGTVTRSFGSAWKTDVTAGVGGYTRKYGPPPDSTLSPEQLQLLQAQVLPHSEDATYLLGTLRFFKAEYQTLRNVETYNLTEDFQMGPAVFVGARWAIPIFTNNPFIDLAGAVRYRWHLAQDLLTVAVSGAVRVVPDGRPVNRHVAFELYNASPPFEGGRFVTRLLVDWIEEDLDKRILLLGGGNGLRGAPAELLAGRNLFLLNVEYRTRSFEFHTNYVGFVLFYDAGSAFDTTISLTHTLGLGMRILVPQWNQEVIRFDFGFVIGGQSPIAIDRLNASYGQVTEPPLRPIFLDTPLGYPVAESGAPTVQDR